MLWFFNVTVEQFCSSPEEEALMRCGDKTISPTAFGIVLTRSDMTTVKEALMGSL